MPEGQYITVAKVSRQAEVIADANDLKADSGFPVSAIRRAERDALKELTEDFGSPEDVEAVPLPSDRLDEDDYGGAGSDDEDVDDEEE